MPELSIFKQLISAIKKELFEIKASIDIDKNKSKLKVLEEKMNEADFWDNSSDANKILKEIKIIKSEIDIFSDLFSRQEDAEVMFNMIEDDFLAQDNLDFYDELLILKKDTDKFVLSTLLDLEYDKNNAILSIHPGAGGTESADWANMLLRMFTRFSERSGYKVKVLDYLSGESAGIKSVTLLIEGVNAYGFLKTMKGVHRLVRISPFDSAKRRHTSFASVDVMPEILDDTTIEIDPKDIKIDTFRAGGAGGQHVNKTDSAVRITHLKTGVVVSCQNERSQHKNKETAMKILKGKLIEILEEEKKDKIADIKGNYAKIEWGSQICSYVMHPYSLVKDHRTNYQTGNVSAVLDGEFFDFIDKYLKERRN